MNYAKEHNPDGLTPGQVGVKDGWRLLTEEEVSPYFRATLSTIEKWAGWWDAGWAGNSVLSTYRTKLTQAQLRKARGLPEQPTERKAGDAACRNEKSKGSPSKTSNESTASNSPAGTSEPDQQGDTPESDNINGMHGFGDCVSRDFARALERERNALRSKVERLTLHISKLERAGRV